MSQAFVLTTLESTVCFIDLGKLNFLIISLPWSKSVKRPDCTSNKTQMQCMQSMKIDVNQKLFLKSLFLDDTPKVSATIKRSNWAVDHVPIGILKLIAPKVEFPLLKAFADVVILTTKPLFPDNTFFSIELELDFWLELDIDELLRPKKHSKNVIKL